MHIRDVLLRIHIGLLCVLAAFIPGPFRLSPPVIILLCGVWGLRMPIRGTLNGLRRSPLLIGWILYFLIHLASYQWSEDKSASSFDLETKLSFFALPLLIGASAPLSRRSICWILNAFAGGVLLIAIACLIQAAGRHGETGTTPVFLYHELVRGLDANAVYTAWYTTTALCVLLFYPLPWLTGTTAGRIFHVVGLLILSLFIFLLSSRTLVLFYLLVIVPVAIVQYWRRSRGAARWPLVLTIGLIGLTGITATLMPGPLRNRFEDISGKGIAVAFRPDYHGYSPEFSNLSLRLFLWRVGYHNMKEHNLWLLGAGNGDVHPLQNSRMAKMGIGGIDTDPPTSSLYNVNMHNMVVQTALMLGIPAMLLFLWLILYPVRLSRRSPAPTFFLLFFIGSALFMMQEAALQTQAGIVFYLFFSSLFCAALLSGERNAIRVNPL